MVTEGEGRSQEVRGGHRRCEVVTGREGWSQDVMGGHRR